MPLTPLFWVLFTLPLLLFFERQVHRRLRGLFYLLTGSRQYSLYWYSIILLPGVFLHELSHWLFAKFLGLRTGNFSVFPSEDENGSTTLGYVEYYQTPTLDPVREGLVGASPLFAGVTAVVLISRHLFDTPVILSLIQSAEPTIIIQAAFSSFQSADSFFWLYVLFAISNSMMPSSADRRAWPLLFVALGTMVAALYFMGIIPILINRHGNSAAQMLNYIALAFTITILIDMIAIPILFLLEKLAERITGYRIHYK